MNLKGWRRGESCDVEISELELEILANYEAEEERGIMHSPIWHMKMRQLEALRDRKEREAVELAPTCPSSLFGHDFNASGRCYKCGNYRA